MRRKPQLVDRGEGLACGNAHIPAFLHLDHARYVSRLSHLIIEQCELSYMATFHCETISRRSRSSSTAPRTFPLSRSAGTWAFILLPMPATMAWRANVRSLGLRFIGGSSGTFSGTTSLIAAPRWPRSRKSAFRSPPPGGQTSLTNLSNTRGALQISVTKAVYDRFRRRRMDRMKRSYT